ncbi:hypothetical protein QBC45DRAFT_405804 [Copromyces sp. CBS 386.78]|nr:hypothetical protein QBC45DRAFT_405804 [Copromyces sp. CBS 386.78]
MALYMAMFGGPVFPLTTRPYEDSEVVARLTVRLRLCTPFPTKTWSRVDVCF